MKTNSSKELLPPNLASSGDEDGVCCGTAGKTQRRLGPNGRATNRSARGSAALPSYNFGSRPRVEIKTGKWERQVLSDIGSPSVGNTRHLSELGFESPTVGRGKPRAALRFKAPVSKGSGSSHSWLKSVSVKGKPGSNTARNVLEKVDVVPVGPRTSEASFSGGESHNIEMRHGGVERSVYEGPSEMSNPADRLLGESMVPATVRSRTGRKRIGHCETRPKAPSWVSNPTISNFSDPLHLGMGVPQGTRADHRGPGFGRLLVSAL